MATAADLFADHRPTYDDLIIEAVDDNYFHEKEEEEGSGSDYEELADDCEDFMCDLTKKFNSAGLSNYRPNRQTKNVDSVHQAASLRSQTLRSGEAFIQAHMNKLDGGKTQRKQRDRSDRATIEQVMDPRTRLILFQLIQRGLFERIEGCISTGKEANVYHGVTLDGSLAIKIYKTSILTFKDRDRYVTGEYRYRSGYCRHNPRKMVATWAEKEVRNLQRMHLAGLPVPKPILLKGHVLVMEFIGEDGWPAPLLKNAELDCPKLIDKLYCDCVRIMCDLYRKCRLVHADLSEYNMLLLHQKLFVIDVSQSVEHDHPHALEFLRMDIGNVTRFFRERGAHVLTMMRLFELIVDPLLDEQIMERALMDERTDGPLPDESLFMSAYIPHKLDNIEHFERDYHLEKQGHELNNPYQKVIGKTLVGLGTRGNETQPEKEKVSSSSSSNSDLSEEDKTGSETDASFDYEERSKEAVNKKDAHQRYLRVRGESPTDRKSVV